MPGLPFELNFSTPKGFALIKVSHSARCVASFLVFLHLFVTFDPQKWSSCPTSAFVHQGQVANCINPEDQASRYVSISIFMHSNPHRAFVMLYAFD